MMAQHTLPKINGFASSNEREVLARLAEYLEEAHQEELLSDHCGDGPSGCTYCDAIADAKRVLAGKDVPEVNGYASAVGMAAALPLRTALKWHLQSNHFPPVPSVMVPVAERAVLAARGDDWAKLLRLPDGVRYRGNVKASVADIVESFHLDAFVETQEEAQS